MPKFPNEMVDLSIEEKSICSTATIRNCVFIQTMSKLHFINKHSIIFKNDPALLVKKLPKPISTLDETVNLYIAGDINNVEKRNILKAHRIRSSKVRSCLEFLTQNNSLYKKHEIDVDYVELNNIPSNGTANCTIHGIQPNSQKNTHLDASQKSYTNNHLFGNSEILQSDSRITFNDNSLWSDHNACFKNTINNTLRRKSFLLQRGNQVLSEEKNPEIPGLAFSVWIWWTMGRAGYYNI